MTAIYRYQQQHSQHLSVSTGIWWAGSAAGTTATIATRQMCIRPGTVHRRIFVREGISMLPNGYRESLGTLS